MAVTAKSKKSNAKTVTLQPGRLHLLYNSPHIPKGRNSLGRPILHRPDNVGRRGASVGHRLCEFQKWCHRPGVVRKCKWISAHVIITHVNVLFNRMK